MLLGNSRSRTLIDRWAEANGYQIISSERRYMLTGPFFFRSSKGQTVFRIRARDSAGRVREGWARCGGWILGLLSDAVKVEWDAADSSTRT
jgi:hypothetical protein